MPVKLQVSPKNRTRPRFPERNRIAQSLGTHWQLSSAIGSNDKTQPSWINQRIAPDSATSKTDESWMPSDAQLKWMPLGLAKRT